MDKHEIAEYRFTVGEAAQELGVSASRIRQYVMTGALVGIKRSGALFFTIAEIERFRSLPKSKGGRPKKVKSSA